jgi:predicted amidohydrolase YtcJ
LNAIAAARATNGYSGRLHDVGHCTFVAQSDLPRARAIAATFEVSPYLWSPSPINDSITAAVGEERIKRVWPVREMLEAGALVVPGSDWAVVPSVSPWNALEMLVTRKVPGGSGDVTFGGPQAITLEQGIAMFTVNSARHRGMGDKVGQIDVGMLADVVVVDPNPLDIPVTKVHEVLVRMTLIQGEVVYRAPAAGK